MKHRSPNSSKHQPRGFESLELRHALDGTTVPTLIQLQLPTNTVAAPLTTAPASPAAGQTLPLMAVRVYAAPIGPAPATVKPATGTPSPTGSNLPVMTLAAAQRLGTIGSGNFIGPIRPATLPAKPLYADGVLPTNQTPANLPTERVTMPIVTDPPDSPFKLAPIRPLH